MHTIHRYVFTSLLVIVLSIPGWLRAAEIADKDITVAVETELLASPAVPSYYIDVVTTDGIVTLTGTVGNALAKDQAARVAESMKGVRAVVNQIEVKPINPPSDFKLKDQIKKALEKDPAITINNLDVDVLDGFVTLKGNADSYTELQLAVNRVTAIKGVVGVKEKISVDYDDDKTDKQIKAEIEKVLKWNVWIDDALIDVTVNDKVVTLSGTVGSAAEKRTAVDSSWVPGVNEVNADKLAVDWTLRDEMRRKYDKTWAKDDEKVKEAIKDALLYDPRVASFDISVTVYDGRVNLQGKVDNLSAKRAAGHDAQNTAGVIAVRNLIRVRPPTIIPDDMLEKNVEEAFLQDPIVDRYEIDVMAINGLVYLYGTVDTEYERKQAEKVAVREPGVVDVKNYLQTEISTIWIYSTKTDAELMDDVADQLWWSPFVDRDDITIQVDDGVVTLTGTVDSWNEYYSATENAHQAGAVTVVNNLTVKE